MNKSYLLKTDGTKEEIVPQDAGVGFSFRELYPLIGCTTIELVRLNDGRLLLIDEEGKLKDDAEINQQATTLAADRIGPDVIVGNAVVCDAELIR
jgi:hypothetical protein